MQNTQDIILALKSKIEKCKHKELYAKLKCDFHTMEPIMRYYEQRRKHN